MKGTIDCEGKKCRAGKDVCVTAPSEDYVTHCEPIVAWLDHKTPVPSEGLPHMAGVSLCDWSSNCPKGTVCCLHEIGQADVQAVVCHASLDECRDHDEVCRAAIPGDCRAHRE